VSLVRRCVARLWRPLRDLDDGLLTLCECEDELVCATCEPSGLRPGPRAASTG
jgi:hypothetical protein